MAKPIRPVGDIMLDMEKLLYELHIDHDLQHGEVLYGINGWQKIHVPGQMEPYVDGTKPMMHPMMGIMYGHKSVFVDVLKELKRRKK